MHLGRSIVTLGGVVLLMTVIALPAFAHGENDARPLLRDSTVGPYTVSLWQVIGDHDSTLPPHLIIKVLGDEPLPSDAVWVEVGSTSMEAALSMSEAGTWEAPIDVSGGEFVNVVVRTPAGTYASPVVAVDSLSSGIPMQVFVALAVFFTTGTVYWLARRTTRVFRSHQGIREKEMVTA